MDDRYILTDEDKAVCDAFTALLDRAVRGPVTSASVSLIKRHGTILVASAQDEHEAFSADHEIKDLAGKLQRSLDRVHAANPSEEERKSARIASLKAELARLGEAA